VRYFHHLQTQPPDFVPFYLGQSWLPPGGQHNCTVRKPIFIRKAFQAFFYVPFSWLFYPTECTPGILDLLLSVGIVWKLPLWFASKSARAPAAVLSI
jgi:hypothetical protein